MFNFLKKKNPEEIVEEMDKVVESIEGAEKEKILSGEVQVSDKKQAKEREKGEYFLTAAAAFSHHLNNKKFLLMFFDPETDIFFMSYDDVQAFNKLVDKRGKFGHLVDSALSFNADTMYNIEYVQALQGNIAGGLDSMRKTRKENREKKKGPRIIFQRDKNLTKFKNYNQLAKTNNQFKIEKSEAKKKREAEAAKIREDQNKIDNETGQKESGIDKIRNLFRKRITK